MRILFKEEITEADKKLEDARCISLAATRENFGSIGTMDKIQKPKTPITTNRFVHVFWSKPALQAHEDVRWHVGNQYEFTLALSALSLALLKDMYQEVVLYTDSKGEELLGHLPYDKIYNIFDEFNPPMDFWASGKIEALRHEPLDSIMIDNDLFLYDRNVVDRCNMMPIVGSHEENTQVYRNMIEKVRGFLPGLNGILDTHKSTNCGIMKVEKTQVKDRFVLAYFKAVKLLSDSQTLQALKTLGQGAYCPDLVAEQFNYHVLCKPKHLLELPKYQKDVEGMTHLISFEKYLKMPYVLNTLYCLYPDYFEWVTQKWAEINFFVRVEGMPWL